MVASQSFNWSTYEFLELLNAIAPHELFLFFQFDNKSEDVNIIT